MQNTFLEFRRYNDLALASELIELLKKNDIAYTAVESALSFDPTFVNSQNLTDYTVRIAAADFVKVNQLLVDHEEATLSSIEPDHYLLKFNNSELIDILIKADEWSATDHALAIRLLRLRGAMPNDDKLNELKQEYLNSLRKPAKPQTTWIIVGYIFAVLGGVMGLFIGWHLMKHKNTLPNGEQAYGYIESDRKHGRRIFIVGIIGVLFAVGLRIYRNI
ncbi:hypothetical protein ACFQ3S_08460 [Mucilaginibacter terrae]|uniref:hypothetical protein n=1 Tax=Mucilaginibacter terrae TaxID=1955052 RepID=UPI00363D584B